MRKIFESDYYTYSDLPDSATATSVWQIESEDEFWELHGLKTTDDWERYTGFRSQYNVQAGAKYTTYDFTLDAPYVYITETIAYNV